MTISFTFRHMVPSDAIKTYAEGKILKLQKLLLHPMSARVTLAVEKQQHVAEVQLDSGSEHIEAKETCEELYASIDQVIDKLERQIHASKGGKLARNRRPSTSMRISGHTPTDDVEPAQQSADRKTTARKSATE